jgi:hypothetical protein
MPGAIVSGDSVYIAEGLFESFVTYTTDDKLAAAKRLLTRLVSDYCDVASHSIECHRNLK